MIDEVLAKYPNDVKVVIKNFPLNFHKQARKAAKYALAASRQGKFKEMYHMIFCGTTESVPAEQCTAWRKLKQNEDLPLEYAQALGLNINQLKNDVTDQSFEDLILHATCINKIVIIQTCAPMSRHPAALCAEWRA